MPLHIKLRGRVWPAESEKEMTEEKGGDFEKWVRRKLSERPDDDTGCFSVRLIKQAQHVDRLLGAQQGTTQNPAIFHALDWFDELCRLYLRDYARDILSSECREHLKSIRSQQ